MEFTATAIDVAAARAPVINFHDYEVEGFVQKGGWGTVYAARRKRDGKKFAMKFFGYTDRQPGIAEIANEISLMLSLDGISGVVQLEGVFHDTATGLMPNKNRRFMQPYPVIVMEMIEGGELYARIANRTSVTERYLARMFRSFIRGLQGIHSRRYVHRDLKLDNILLMSADEDTLVKIIDFGLMIRLVPGQDVYRLGPLSGTPGTAPRVLKSNFLFDV
jgi:serine/threonine protein kinase